MEQVEVARAAAPVPLFGSANEVEVAVGSEGGARAGETDERRIEIAR